MSVVSYESRVSIAHPTNTFVLIPESLDSTPFLPTPFLPTPDALAIFHLGEGQGLPINLNGVLGRWKVNNGLGDDCMLNTVMLQGAA